MNQVTINRQIAGYEQLAKLFKEIEHLPIEQWKPSSYFAAKAISLKYSIDMQEVERFYLAETQAIPTKEEATKSIPQNPKPPPKQHNIQHKAKIITPQTNTEKQCEECGTTFKPNKADQRYCSSKCSSKVRMRKLRSKQ